ncbi:MAG: NAD(P)/FAD-dependent oxidoreductase [Ignavibacteriae bacterium]|nr:NAD(P)/FAD-dependent oxidoreductase [Ignavibacteriota bacterium]
MPKKVIIIGAGIAGLSAGCYLQMNGYDTEIFEMHSLPGGLCTSWSRSGYTFDGCLHWVVGSTPSDNLFNLWNELIDMKKIEWVEFDYHSVYSDSDGKTITFYNDIEKLKKELLEKAPEDKVTLNGFLKAVKKFSKFSAPSDKAPETSGFWDGIKMFSKILPYISRYKKWINLSINEFAGFLRNDALRKSFSVHPVEDMSAFFIVMMHAWMNKKSAGYPLGGSLKFSQLIEKKYLELGGRINYRQKVTKINVKNKTACGIQTESGDEHKADIVISAADGHYTIYKMLEGNFKDKKTDKIYKSFETFPSYVQVSLGVNHDFSGIPHMLKFPLGKKLKLDEETEYDNMFVRIFNFDRTMAPPGKTSMYTLFATRNSSYWEYLRKNDKVRYQSEKDRIAGEVIEAIDKKIGNVKANVEEIDVSTPATVIRYTNNWKGSYEGWIPSGQTGIMGLKKTIKGLENFYMIGQWIEVGGGVPSALMSGRNVTQIICKKDKRKFSTTHY